MSHQGKILGVFSKDKMEGPFCEQWEHCLNQHSFTTVNFIFFFNHRFFYDDLG
jgi:hypothetical protein